MESLSVALRGFLAEPGVIVGFVAGLCMTLVQLVIRALWGIATPMELVSERIAPLLNIWVFLALLTIGYNHLKQLGIISVLLGQLIVGTVGGLVYARIQHGLTRALHLQADGFLFLFVTVMWVLSILLLWPSLGTNYKGLPPNTAAFTTGVGLFISYAVYAVVFRAAYSLRFPTPSLQSPGVADEGRRAMLLAGFGVAVGVGVVAMLVDAYRKAAYGYDGTRYLGPDIQPLTPNERFYVVTKNNVDPAPLRDLWRLEITGLVQRPATYRFEALTALPPVVQETTLECISNAVGGGLMSNAKWKGVPLKTLLEAAGPRPGTQFVTCRSVDGFVDEIPFSKAMDPTTLVAYEMNGAPLPLRHGFPVRLIIPGMVGEKNVKWVTRIELRDRPGRGLYERQGWGPNFIIRTTSRFDSPDFSRPIPRGREVVLKGVAFAGDRSVQGVEVSTDGGTTWQEAGLIYRGSPLAWVLWSFAWTPSQAGDYRLVVRAIDGTGAVQDAQIRYFAPSGASGYHRVTAHVQ